MIEESCRVADSAGLPHGGRSRHGRPVGVPIVEGCHILNHGCPRLGWGDIVGMRIGCCMRPESPAGGNHGETRSNGPKWGAEGWCKIDGMGGWSGHWWFAPNCTREYGLVHIPRVAPHGICTGGSMLMMIARAGTRCTAMVVVHIVAMRVPIMPVFKMLDGFAAAPLGVGLLPLPPKLLPL